MRKQGREDTTEETVELLRPPVKLKDKARGVSFGGESCIDPRLQRSTTNCWGSEALKVLCNQVLGWRVEARMRERTSLPQGKKTTLPNLIDELPERLEATAVDGCLVRPLPLADEPVP